MNRRTLFLILGVLVVSLALLAATALFVWRTTKRAVVEEIFTPQEKVVDLSAVVTRVRDLNRLETASMHVVHVGRITQNYRMVPSAIAGDEITFLAEGDVIAGIDLSRLRQQDVWRSPDGTVNVRLPPPQILVTRVDNRKSRVLDRNTGVLRRGDVNLETRARQHAEQNVRAEALRKGILTLAARNAEMKMAELLRTFGVEKVRFVSTQPPVQR